MHICPVMTEPPTLGIQRFLPDLSIFFSPTCKPNSQPVLQTRNWRLRLHLPPPFKRNLLLHLNHSCHKFSLHCLTRKMLGRNPLVATFFKHCLRLLVVLQSRIFSLPLKLSLTSVQTSSWPLQRVLRKPLLWSGLSDRNSFHPPRHVGPASPKKC